MDDWQKINSVWQIALVNRQHDTWMGKTFTIFRCEIVAAVGSVFYWIRDTDIVIDARITLNSLIVFRPSYSERVRWTTAKTNIPLWSAVGEEKIETESRTEMISTEKLADSIEWRGKRCTQFSSNDRYAWLREVRINGSNPNVSKIALIYIVYVQCTYCQLALSWFRLHGNRRNCAHSANKRESSPAFPLPKMR